MPDHTVPAIPDTLPAPYRRRLQSFQWHLEGAGRAERTVGTYLQALIAFGAWLGAAGHCGELGALTRDDIRHWLRTLQAAPHPRTGAPLQPATINNRGRALQAFFKWAAAEYEIPNPMLGVELPKAPETPVADISDADLVLLLRAAEGKDFAARRDAAFLKLLIDTGMRREEISTIRLADLDLRNCKVAVLGKGRGRGKERRACMFSKRARQALDRYLDARERHPATGTPALWLGKFGPLTPSGCYQIVRDRAHLAATLTTDPAQAQRLLHLHPHALRRTAAVRYVEAGGHTEHLNSHMGWRSPTMAARYTRAAKVRLAEQEYQDLHIGEDL